MIKIVVLLSGQGQTLQAIIDRCQHEPGVIEIAAVISDQPMAYGLERARESGIPIHALDRKQFEDTATYHNALKKSIESYLTDPGDLIVLAGYMRILSADFVKAFERRILNIHPSLLPKFPGLDTHQRAIEAHEKEHGTSIHLVTAQLDAGPLIAQAKTEIALDDTPLSLEKKVKALEQTLYPETLFQIAKGEIKIPFKTYFISDLHLSSDHPDITACLLRFLENEAKSADALYILGDFFDAWIGDDCVTELSEQIATALRTLSHENVKIYFMSGNRDFLLQKKYAKRCGMIKLADPSLVSLYGKPVLLMHGDLLCTDDVVYQKFRAKAHSPWLQFIFLSLPLFIRRRIAKHARQKSQTYTHQVSRDIQDVNQTAVEAYMTEFQCDVLIHGHTHRPAIHEFLLQGKPAKRIVLGAWHHAGSAVCYDWQGKISVVSL